MMGSKMKIRSMKKDLRLQMKSIKELIIKAFRSEVQINLLMIVTKMFDYINSFWWQFVKNHRVHWER